MTYNEICNLLAEAKIPNNRGEASILICHFCKINKAELLMRHEDDFSSDELITAVKKRCEHYPLQYILGFWDFCHETYRVTENTLIPRQDTEKLVELAIRYLPEIFLFENGKGVRVPITAYQTKATRRKLVGAYSDASPIVAAFYEDEKKPYELLLVNNQKKAIVLKTSLIPQKTSRTSGGSTLFTCKKGQKITRATDSFADHLDNTGYKKIKIPATGSAISEKDLKKIFN